MIKEFYPSSDLRNRKKLEVFAMYLLAIAITTIVFFNTQNNYVRYLFFIIPVFFFYYATNEFYLILKAKKSPISINEEDGFISFYSYFKSNKIYFKDVYKLDSLRKGKVNSSGVNNEPPYLIDFLNEKGKSVGYLVLEIYSKKDRKIISEMLEKLMNNDLKEIK